MKEFTRFGLLLIFSFIIQSLQGQNLRIRGSVTDFETGDALTGATVNQSGTTLGTITDIDGLFDLELDENEESNILISFLGYETQMFTLDEQKFIEIQLVPQASVLSEVMITALNLKRESKALGYAIQKIGAKEISNVKSVNFIDNLAGLAAGVNVQQGATGVGSTSKITIRGESSFTNNTPLIVVDGTPINNNTILNFTNEAAAGFQEVDFGNGGMEINQDDIESVSILKGPAAAALYGARAANGAIVITSKNGSSSSGQGISFNSSVFIERPFKLPVFQNKFGQGNSGQFEFVDGLGGGVNDNITYSWGPALDAGISLAQFDSPVILADGQTVRGGDVSVHNGLPISESPFISHPDNLKNFYDTGLTTINNIAFNSGHEKGNYRISFTDLRSNSPIPGVNLFRNNLAANLNFTPTEKLSISTNINYVNARSDNRPSGGYGSENINYSLVAWGPRSMNIENLQDYWQPGFDEVQQFSFNYTFFDNPYFILFENKNSFQRDRLFGNVHAQYDIGKNLNLVVHSGMDYSDEDREYRRHFSTNRFKSGAFAEQNVFYREVNTGFLMNYSVDPGIITADFSLGGNRMDQIARTSQTEALGLAQPRIFNFSNASVPLVVNGFEAKKRINSLYGVAKFAINDLLFLDVTGRNDWSSALATPNSVDNVSFFYPSVSLSYLLSKHIQFPSVVSFVKLRSSWAQVGNDTDPYQTTNAFMAGIPFQSQPTLSIQNTIANANLLPEQTRALEFGFDLRLFDDRFRLDATYYNALTENQIISLPVPVSSGFNQKVINGGAVRSEGIELIAGMNILNSNSLKWNTQFNFSRNVSTVEALPDEAKRITLAYTRVYDNENQTVWFQAEEGGRVGDMYGTGYLKNENGDFIIGEDGRYIVDNTLQLLGNYNPDFVLGINNDFSFKNWTFNFLLDWRKGGELISRTLSLAAVGGQLIETEDRPESGIIADGVFNAGSNENPQWVENSTAISPESYYRQFYDRNHEENNVYDASYLKLRQLALTYTFDRKDTNADISLSLIGRNLFAISEIPHFDPEQLAVQGNRFISGVEDMSYPSTRSIGLKLSVKL